jgi:hypothetical protein
MFNRTLYSDNYNVFCQWNDTNWMFNRTGPHSFILYSDVSINAFSVELQCIFYPAEYRFAVGNDLDWVRATVNATKSYVCSSSLPSMDETVAQVATAWDEYYSSGAFVDLASGSSDPSAFELERRTVLSLYLLRANSASTEPPQETGLLCDGGWSGKHHSEMRYWHQGAFPLWGRGSFLARSDGFYLDLLQNATGFAEMQGYQGARWPKMTAGISNRSGIDVPWLGQPQNPNHPYNLLVWESPNTINPFLVWHQPHMILLSEFQYQEALASGANVTRILSSLSHLVFATAEFLASFVTFDESINGYVLASPIMGGEEEGDFRYVQTPSFERTYFAYTLDLANEWRVRMNSSLNETWEAISSNMAPLPFDYGYLSDSDFYSFNLNSSCCFLPPNSPLCPSGVRAAKAQCNPLQSHPLIVGMVGMINGLKYGNKYGIDVAVFNRTVAAVVSNWSWGSMTDGENVWGWDFGLVAMAMTRLGWSREAVVSLLLKPVIKNYYFDNGQNYQRSSLPAYLPGNGALLLAVATMAAGTDTSPAGYFPISWNAQVERFLMKYP